MTLRTAERILAIMVILGLTAAAALAQAGRGMGRLGGVVLDPDGNPLPGAKVTLAFKDNKNLIFDQTSGKKGEWSFIGLGTGDWILAVTAPGFLPYDNLINVSQLSVNPKVQVQMKKPEKGSGVISDEQSVELLEQGNQFFKEDRYDDAIAAYNQFFAANPGLYQIQVSIADCYREKGEFDKAVELYNEVLKLAEGDATLGREMKAKSLAGIGNVLLKQNKLTEAQDFLRKSIESSPDDEVLAYNVGEIYFSNQNLDEALRYFELAAGIKPGWPDPFLKLGYVYLNKVDNAKAIENFEKFLELEPEGERAALVRNILSVIRK
jgi:Tfp pilus assembly protein PilF